MTCNLQIMMSAAGGLINRSQIAPSKMGGMSRPAMHWLRASRAAIFPCRPAQVPGEGLDGDTIARAMDVVCDRWSILLLREAYYGTKRFDEFQYYLGVAPNVLSTRV